MTIHDYVLRQKLQESVKLLVFSGNSIIEVALLVLSTFLVLGVLLVVLLAELFSIFILIYFILKNKNKYHYLQNTIK